MRKTYLVFLLLLTIVIFSCKTKLDVEDQKNEEEQKNSNIVAKEKTVEKTEYFEIEIILLEGTSEVILNGKNVGKTPLKLNIEKGERDIFLRREGYPDQICKIDVFKNQKIVLKHSREKVLYKEVGVFECGEQPKQVIFSPDDNFIFLPLLDDTGFQVFDAREKRIASTIEPSRSKERGFAEGIFIENQKNERRFFVSQMTTGYIYEYSYPETKLLREISTGGKWPKYIAYSKELNIVAVSNWATNDVSIIDYDTGKIIKKIGSGNAPRGMVFTNDGGFLIVLCFEGGAIEKISTKNWKVEKKIYKKNAAMRHIVLNKDNTKAYVSNMYHFEIYEIDLKEFKILHTYKVYYNPNTIDLKDDKLL
ncbi:MAG TPA: PEGA domain-containing protein, partial [Spirochaetota bacterium]|nr:PEGA domain-containing protein [Spirochaetota bacterium]